METWRPQMPHKVSMKYAKSESGQQAFKERSPLLSPRQRSVFIMFDGEKSVESVLGATHGLGVTQVDVDYLLEQGFLIAVPDATHETNLDIDLGAQAPVSEQATKQSRYAAAKPIATRLTASLGLRGFRLNLAVESASGYDELVALLPKIQEAVGSKASRELEQVLNG